MVLVQGGRVARVLQVMPTPQGLGRDLLGYLPLFREVIISSVSLLSPERMLSQPLAMVLPPHPLNSSTTARGCFQASAACSPSSFTPAALARCWCAGGTYAVWGPACWYARKRKVSEGSGPSGPGGACPQMQTRWPLDARDIVCGSRVSLGIDLAGECDAYVPKLLTPGPSLLQACTPWWRC